MKFRLSAFMGVLLTGSVAFAQETPKADLFFGYSGFRSNQAQNLGSFNMAGGIFQGAYNFNNHLAFVGEVAGYLDNNVRGHRIDMTRYSYLFGPRLSLGRSRRFDPFVHTLFGVNNARLSIASNSNLIPVNPIYPPGTTIPTPGSDGRYRVSQTNFGMAAGLGLDVRIVRHFGLRLFQLDYYLTRFEAPSIINPSGNTSNRNQNNYRASAGLLFNIGGEKPTPPPPPPPPAPTVTMKSCPDGTSIPETDTCPKLNMGIGINVVPSSVCQGAAAQVSMSGNLPRGAMYNWTLDGEPVSRNATFEFGAAGRSPGSHRIGVTVSADGYNDATSQATVNVLGYVPPTGTLSVSRPEIYVGETTLLDATFRGGQCGGQIGPTTYTASEGSINGKEFNSTGVRFDPPGPTEQRKTVMLAARAADERGSATAEASVVVKQRAAIGAQRFSDIVFLQDSSRVNNCGKRVLLEDLKNKLDSDPGGKVLFVGHTGTGEKNADLATKRALNAAAVISAGEGICPRFPASSIFVKAGSADNGVDFQPNFCAASNERPGQAVPQTEDAKTRRVEVWFVPTGGAIPANAVDARNASTLGVASLGCPR
jgi:outer membrane protein OmpA-like peptidoglycan-associated protein